MRHCSISCLALNRPLDTAETGTVCCDTRQMGMEAVNLFLARCQNPTGPKQHPFLPPVLLERDSIADLAASL